MGWEYETKIVDIGERGFWTHQVHAHAEEAKLTKLLNEMAADGWRLSATCPVVMGSPAETKKLVYHFERERKG